MRRLPPSLPTSLPPSFPPYPPDPNSQLLGTYETKMAAYTVRIRPR